MTFFYADEQLIAAQKKTHEELFPFEKDVELEVAKILSLLSILTGETEAKPNLALPGFNHPYIELIDEITLESEHSQPLGDPPKTRAKLSNLKQNGDQLISLSLPYSSQDQAVKGVEFRVNFSQLLSDIKKKHPAPNTLIAVTLGQSDKHFWGNTHQDVEPLIIPLNPTISPQLAIFATPKGGWIQSIFSSLYLFIFIGSSLILMLIGTLYNSIRVSDRLTKTVEERTRSLQERTEQLHSNQQRLNAIFQAYPDIQLVLSKDSHVVEVHIPDNSCSPWNAGQLQGEHFPSLFNHNHQQRIEAAIKKVLDLNQASTIEFPVEINERINTFEARVVTVNSQNLLVICRNITQRIALDNQLRESEIRFRRIFETAPFGICLFNLYGQILDCNPEMSSIVQIHSDQLLGSSLNVLLEKESIKEFKSCLESINDGTSFSGVLTLKGRDRSPIIVEFQTERILLQNELLFYGIFKDITLRVSSEAKLRLHASVFASTQEGIIITDTNICITSVNPAFTQITGYTEQEAIGHKPNLLKSEKSNPELYTQMWKALSEEGHWQGEIWNRAKNGRVYPEWLTISAVKNDRGVVENYVGIFSDISPIKETEELLRFQANHDLLTGLPNRNLLDVRMTHAIEQAKRRRSKVGLLFIDLDHFKPVNDTHGHEVGDMLLMEIAHRMKAVTRLHDTVSRVGGDEFLILTENVRDDHELACLSKRILNEITRPVNICDLVVSVSASIGISLYPDHGLSSAELIRHADAAMYQIKHNGRSGFAFHSDDNA